MLNGSLEFYSACSGRFAFPAGNFFTASQNVLSLLEIPFAPTEYLLLTLNTPFFLSEDSLYLGSIFKFSQKIIFSYKYFFQAY